MLPAGFRGLRKGCCGTHISVSRWVGGGVGEWGDSGAESGNGGGFREPGSGNWGAGNGVRETGIRESQISGIRGIRKPETVSEFTGVHNCALGNGIRRNSPPETPRKPPRKP